MRTGHEKTHPRDGFSFVTGAVPLPPDRDSSHRLTVESRSFLTLLDKLLFADAKVGKDKAQQVVG